MTPLAVQWWKWFIRFCSIITNQAIVSHLEFHQILSRLGLFQFKILTLVRYLLCIIYAIHTLGNFLNILHLWIIYFPGCHHYILLYVNINLVSFFNKSRKILIRRIILDLALSPVLSYFNISFLNFLGKLYIFLLVLLLLRNLINHHWIIQMVSNCLNRMD